MGEKRIVARLLPALHHVVGGSSPTAKSIVEWARQNRDVFWPRGKESGRPQRIDWNALPRLARAVGEEDATASAVPAAEAVAVILAFDHFDAELLRCAAAMQHEPRIAELRSRLIHSGQDLVLLLGLLAGADAGSAAQRVRCSPALTLGLLEIEGRSIGLDWRFSRLLSRGIDTPEALTEALVGPRQRATLDAEDFAHHADAFAFLTRLLTGALTSGLAGINILLHGPPGTGKTEFARALAAAADVALFATGETDDDGNEPTRWERLCALRRGQRLLRRHDSTLLFDEMEDLLAETTTRNREQISKVFINRLLETNPVPTIWTSNDIHSVDPAHLRRMSFILRMDHPGIRWQEGVIARMARDEGLPDGGAALACLAEDHPATSSIARVALRAAVAAGGDRQDAMLAARSLLAGLSGGRMPRPATTVGRLDLDLFETDPPVAQFVADLANGANAGAFSLLMSGPPGTGKTALAGHVADTLGRRLIVQRGSDILSKWVGGTEANIAAAFEQARSEDAILFFDEVDSLLQDRAAARAQWEVSQVNELLNWMDGDTSFIAATNHAARLDPATIRRFVFKIVLQELTHTKAAKAFASFFDLPAPPSLARIERLTPGDFAIVARQLRFRATDDPNHIVRMLAAEAAAKTSGNARIGF
ncbi:MAG TPA: ATP-binding protein [Allosphingosinicella sp.]|nr:ATP-binding protein [Allosphingosinicella sp.]